MKKLLSLFLLLSCLLGTVSAEDGSRLWLRQSTDAHAQITAPRQSPTLNIAVRELKQAWKGLPVTLVLKKDKQLSSEGFRIRQVNGKLTVTSPSETGLLYAAYHLIRLQEMRNFGKPSETDQEITENPAYDLRILNHWDNLDRSIERGYAGKSLWNWEELPGTLSDRYEAYARANASIGINATVLNNVNASSKNPFRRISGKGKGSGRRIPSLRHQGVSLYQLCLPHATGRAFHSRSFGQRCHRLVEAESQRDLPHHP